MKKLAGVSFWKKRTLTAGGGEQGVDGIPVSGCGLFAENGGTGYEDFCTGFGTGSDGGGIHPAVDFDRDTPSGGLKIAVAARLDFTDFFNGAGNELLTAEPGVDAHQENEVDFVHFVVKVREGRRRIKDEPRFAARVADGGERPVNVAARFAVKRNDVGTGLSKRFDETVHGFHHEMHVHRELGVGTQGLQYERPHGEVGDIVIVHDVIVKPLGAGRFDGFHFVGKKCKVGGQERRRNVDLAFFGKKRRFGHGGNNEKPASRRRVVNRKKLSCGDRALTADALIFRTHTFQEVHRIEAAADFAAGRNLSDRAVVSRLQTVGKLMVGVR